MMCVYMYICTKCVYTINFMQHVCTSMHSGELLDISSQLILGLYLSMKLWKEVIIMAAWYLQICSKCFAITKK